MRTLAARGADACLLVCVASVSLAALFSPGRIGLTLLGLLLALVGWLLSRADPMSPDVRGERRAR